MATSQAHYRIRSNDSVSGNADSGWAAGLDTPATIHSETQFGVRFELEETAGVSTGSVAYKLQYRHQPTGGSIGAWTDMRVEANTGEEGAFTSRVCVGLSAGATNGTATTNVLTTGGSSRPFVAGIVRTGGPGLVTATALTNAVTLSNQHTEMEFRCRLHKFSDGLIEVKQGDTFEFRLVTSAGATLTSYVNTPSITVGSSSNIVGGTWVESPNRIGPWQDGNGVLYSIQEWAVTANQFLLVKSTNGGSTWTEAQPTNRPGATINDIESADARLVNHVLHIAIQGPSGDDAWYLRYHTSSHPTTPDTWQITGELVAATANPAHQNAALEVRSDGSVVLAYCEIDTTDHIAYRIRAPGGGWGAQTIINTGDGLIYNHIVTVKEAGNDKVWLFYWRADGSIRYRSLAGTTLSAEATLATGLPVGAAHLNPTLTPVSYTTGGQQIVLVAWKTTSDHIAFAQFTDGVKGSTSTIVSVPVARSLGTSHQPVAGWALDDTTAHLYYADAATLDMWHLERAHGGSWSTPTEIMDGVTAHWIRAEKVTGGVGLVWDNGSDGGTGYTRYALYEIGGAGPGTEDLTIPATATVTVADTLTAATTAVQWYPGHYAINHVNADAAFRQTMVDDPLCDPFDGFFFRYLWATCETTQGNYQAGFDIIDADIARVVANGLDQKLLVMLQYKTFDAAPCVPTYVRTETTYQSSNGSYTGQIAFDTDTRAAMIWKPAVNTRLQAWITAMVNHLRTHPNGDIIAGVVFNETSLGGACTQGVLANADYDAFAYMDAIRSNLLTVTNTWSQIVAFYYHQGGFHDLATCGVSVGQNAYMGDWLIQQQRVGAGTPDAKPNNPASSNYVLVDPKYQGKIASIPNVQANDYALVETDSLQESFDYMSGPTPGLRGHFLVWQYKENSANDNAFTFADVSAFIPSNPAPNTGLPVGWAQGGGGGGFPVTTAPTVTQVTTNSTSHVVTIPAHSKGALILLFSGFDGFISDGFDVSGITALNGVAWTRSVSAATQSPLATPVGMVAYLWAGSNQATPTTVTVTTIGNLAETSLHHVYVVTGAHHTSPPEFAFSTNNTTSYDPPALNPAGWDVEKTLWFVFSTMDDNVGTASITSVPANYGDATITNMHLGSSGGVNVATARRALEAGSDDPGTGAQSISRQNIAYTVAVRPSGFPATFAPTVTTNTSVTSAKTVNIPAHSAGDLLLLVHGWQGPNAGTVSGITTVNGATWATRHAGTDGHPLGEPALSVAWLRATADQGTPTTVTVTQSQTGRSITHVHRVVNPNPTLAPEFSFASANGATWDPAPLDPAAWGSSKTLWFVAAVADADVGTETITSGPSGYTPATTNMLLGAGNGINVFTGWRENEATSEDPGTGSNSSAEQTLVYTIAVPAETSAVYSEDVTVSVEAAVTVADDAPVGVDVFDETPLLLVAATVEVDDALAGGSESVTVTAAATVSVADIWVPAGDTTWVQLLGDDTTRIEIPYLRNPSETWTVTADGPWVADRRYQLGLVGEHVTNQWSLETVWPSADRPLADDFVALIRAAGDAPDARLLVNLSAPYGGSPILFVGEVNQISQQFESGMSTVSLTVARVDAEPVFTGPFVYSEVLDLHVGGNVTVTVTENIVSGGAFDENTLDIPIAATVTVADNVTSTSLVVPLSVTQIDGTGNYSHVQPGDTLTLESGTRGALTITALVGSAGNPITITDDGGVVDIVGSGDPAVMSSGQQAALDIRGGSKHLRVVGSNTQVGAAFTAANQQARIRCSRAQRGIQPRLTEGVEFIELAYIEVFDTTGNPGIHTGEGVRANFPILSSFWIHHNYVHDILDSEGMYIGDSAWNALATSSELDGVVVEYNLVEDIDHDGMQCGAARYTTNIPGGYSKQMFRGNVIRRTGLVSPQAAHDRGISSQRGNSNFHIIDNVIVDAGGHGINDQALEGTYLIANNLVVRWARTDLGMDGINIGNGDGTGGQLGGVHIVNNTLVDGPNYGIEPNRDGAGTSSVRNNVVVGAGFAAQIEANATWVISGNLTSTSISAAGFVDEPNGDYHSTAVSAAVDVGTDLSGLGFSHDLDGVSRPQGDGWDRGCYERAGGVPPPGGDPLVTFTSTNGTAPTFDIPAHATGDLILLLIGGDGDNVLSTLSALNGVSWTILHTSGAVRTNCSFHVAYARATSNQPAPTTVSTTWTDNEQYVCHAFRVTSPHATSDPEVVVSPLNSGAAMNCPSLTASWGADDNLWLVAGVLDGDGTRTITSAPTNYAADAEITNTANANNVNFGTSWRTTASATEDPDSWGKSSDAVAFAATVVVRDGVL